MSSKKIVFTLFILICLSSCNKDKEKYEKKEINVQSVFDDYEEDNNRNKQLEDKIFKDNISDNSTNLKDTQEVNDNEENQSGSRAIVTDTVNLRESPSVSEDNVLSTLEKDTEVIILEETDGRSRVDINGQAGYIKSDLLEEVK